MEVLKPRLLKRFIKQIEADNKIFNEATPAQKRVIVAQDCIERIKMNQIIPQNQIFLNDSDFKKMDKNKSLQSVLNTCNIESPIQCEACGKGGLFLSYVGRTNEFYLNQLNFGNDINDNQHKKLLELFSLEQLALIEAAFEGEQLIGLYYEKERVDLSAFENEMDDNGIEFSKYYNKYPDERKRLIAICKNIIKNEGTFVY